MVVNALFGLARLPKTGFVLFTKVNARMLVFFLSTFSLSKMGQGRRAKSSVMINTVPTKAIITNSTVSRRKTAPIGANTVLKKGMTATNKDPSVMIMRNNKPMRTNTPIPSIRSITSPIGGTPIAPRVRRTAATCLRRLGTVARVLSHYARRTRAVSRSARRVGLLDGGLTNVGTVCRVRLHDMDARVKAVSRMRRRAHEVTHRVRRLGRICTHVLRTVASGWGEAVVDFKSRAPHRGVVGLVCVILVTLLTLGISSSILHNFALISRDLAHAASGSSRRGHSLCGTLTRSVRGGPRGIKP